MGLPEEKVACGVDEAVEGTGGSEEGSGVAADGGAEVWGEHGW